MVEADNWFSVQAAASAERLAQTPASLLGPAGRELRNIATRWSSGGSGISGVVAGVQRDQTDSAEERSVQLPLLGAVD
jgi:hypothetical protein